MFQVDIAYIPFIERFQIVLNELFKCEITAERPKLSAWIEVYIYIYVIFHVKCEMIDYTKPINIMFAGNEQD